MQRVLLLIFVFTVSSLQAQFNLKRQIPEKMKFEKTVIDSTYGITMYEGLNFQLKGDSVRMCGNYACQSWVEDVYTSGELLHKGFYIDGQLKTYKNYYPDGKIERDFRAIDNYRSTLKTYHLNGQLKSEIRYYDGDAESWIDYNDKGIKIYEEQFTKNLEFLEFRNFYSNDGKPEKLLVVKDKKKHTYTYTEYHANGKIKVQGEKIYDNNRFDYVNHSKWQYFDESGSLQKEEEWNKGDKVKG